MVRSRGGQPASHEKAVSESHSVSIVIEWLPEDYSLSHAAWAWVERVVGELQQW